MEYLDISAKDLAGYSDYRDHILVRRITDRESGLRAFISIHDETLGPALGGCRMARYQNEEEAIRDVLRLSRGMTYKNALAGLPFGGGKSVILGDPYADKTEDLMAAMGRAVDELGGRYITAEDSGISEEDIMIMLNQTAFVTGFKAEAAGGLGGDPSPVTAYGVYSGMKEAVSCKYGSKKKQGLTVAVQGLGAVGYELCRLLHNDGARLIVTDIREETLSRIKEELPGIEAVEPDMIFDAAADVFAPCALGAQINDMTIPRLQAEIIAGAANNQLAEDKHAALLKQRGILYVPDYVLNAGGVISAAYEYLQRRGENPFDGELNRETMMRHVRHIGQTLRRIFETSDREHITTAAAADRLAESVFMEKRGVPNPVSKSSSA